MESHSTSVVSLSYESTTAVRGPRPKWVWAIVIIYGLLLAALLCIPPWLGSDDRNSNISMFVVLAILAACWFALIMIPLRAVRKRPITRSSIWIPILASGLLIGLLYLGAVMALTEYFRGTASNITLLAFPIGWTMWSVIFWLISRSATPESIGSRLHRYVLAGSVLELLIAVPAHIVVRQRTDCCAGMYTGMGICAGIAVMLVGFGPSVIFLYYRRVKQISNR